MSSLTDATRDELIDGARVPDSIKNPASHILTGMLTNSRPDFIYGRDDQGKKEVGER